MGRLLALAAVVVLVAVGVFLGSAIAQHLTPVGPEVPAAAAAGHLSDGVRIRVEVLNGGGVDGAAGAATDALRDMGFDVVYWGNASDFGQDSSVVLDRVGRMKAARAVADALGIPNVRSEPDSNLYLDASVVLGTDWQPEPATLGTPETARPAWWNPLRWLGR